MTTKYAWIPEIKKGIVFSDPWYGPEVWCQHRQEFTDQNWLMKLNTRVDDGILDFELFLGRPTVTGRVSIREGEEGQTHLSYPSRYEVKQVELGIDTACIFCGSMENWDMAKDEAAIHTGADGLFGNLMVFTCRGEDAPAGYVLIGSVDADMISEDMLYQTMKASFDGEKITEKMYETLTNQTNIDYLLLTAAETRHADEAAKSKENTPEKDQPDR